MTYRSVLDAILAYCGQSSGTDFETLAKVVCNGVYRRVLDKGDVKHEQRVFTLTTAAATAEYGMPLYVRKILNIEDPTNDRFVWTAAVRDMDRSLPGDTTSGTPTTAYPVGIRGVQKYPAANGKLGFVSSDAADTGSSYKVRVTGFNASGVLVSELVTMTGATKAETTNIYSATLGVERITKYPASTAFAGNVTATDSGDNAISVIPVWWDSPDYEWVKFYPIPAAAIAYNVRCEMRKPPLVEDEDWPEFDQEFHDLLIWGSTQDLLPTLGKGSTADRHRLTFKERMDEFMGVSRGDARAVWVFANVQSAVGIVNRPHRPLIPGVDTGLASYP